MRKRWYFFFEMFQSCLSDFFLNDGAMCPVNQFMNRQPFEPYKIAQITITESGVMNFLKRN